MIKVDKFDKLFLSHMQRDAYTFHVGDNNCRDIKVGDDIEIDGMVGKVESLEWSAKMFNGIDGKPLKGDNVTILISQNKDDEWCHYSGMPSPNAYNKRDEKTT